MADCKKQFDAYLEKVRLGSEKKKSLRTSRNANRERIEKYFSETLKKEVPVFHGQGSYKMGTMINPLDGDYDIDDGVYLQGLGTDPSKWPSSDTVHCWIIKAVEGYTKEPPCDKARCVRVRYSADYHVDLPIYAANSSGAAMLFENGKDPYESDAKAFTDWFQAEVKNKGEQVRRVVIYDKGWRDKQKSGLTKVSGLALTILAVDQFKADDRDDVALVETVKKMCEHMENGGGIFKPVAPFENVAASWTEEQRSNFIEKLKVFRDRGVDALESEDVVEASKIWQKLFGDRFPIAEAESKARAMRTSGPAILGNDGRSA